MKKEKVYKRLKNERLKNDKYYKYYKIQHSGNGGGSFLSLVLEFELTFNESNNPCSVDSKFSSSINPPFKVFFNLILVFVFAFVLAFVFLLEDLYFDVF